MKDWPEGPSITVPDRCGVRKRTEGKYEWSGLADSKHNTTSDEITTFLRSCLDDGSDEGDGRGDHHADPATPLVGARTSDERADDIA